MQKLCIPKMKSMPSKGTNKQTLVPSTLRLKFTPFKEKMSIKKEIFNKEIYKSMTLWATSFKSKVAFSL